MRKEIEGMKKALIKILEMENITYKINSRLTLQKIELRNDPKYSKSKLCHTENNVIEKYEQDMNELWDKICGGSCIENKNRIKIMTSKIRKFLYHFSNSCLKLYWFNG